MLWNLVRQVGVEIGHVAVESDASKVRYVFPQHAVHCFETAYCEDRVLKRWRYGELGDGASPGADDEVDERRMDDVDYALFVLGYNKHGSETLAYTTCHSSAEVEEKVEGNRG